MSFYPIFAMVFLFMSYRYACDVFSGHVIVTSRDLWIRFRAVFAFVDLVIESLVLYELAYFPIVVLGVLGRFFVEGQFVFMARSFLGFRPFGQFVACVSSNSNGVLFNDAWVAFFGGYG